MAGRSGDGLSKHEAFQLRALLHPDHICVAALHISRNPDDAKDLPRVAVLRAYRVFDQLTSVINLHAWSLKTRHNYGPCTVRSLLSRARAMMRGALRQFAISKGHVGA